MRKLIQPPKGIRTYFNREGHLVSETSIFAIPGYTKERYEEERRRAVDKRIFDREMGLDDTIHDGEPVFPQFSRTLHGCLDPLVQWEGEGGSRIMTSGVAPNAIHCRAYDFGLEPAALWFQILKPPVMQVQFLLEAVTRNTSSVEFAPYVRKVTDTMPGFTAGGVVDTGDPAGVSKDQGSGKSPFDYFAEHGILVNPSECKNNWEARRSAVVWLLTDMATEEAPRCAINTTGCPVLVEGLGGGYKLREIILGATKGDENPVFHDEPLKNWYSHVCDAFGYAAVLARSIIEAYQAPDAPRAERKLKRNSVNR